MLDILSLRTGSVDASVVAVVVVALIFTLVRTEQHGCEDESRYLLHGIIGRVVVDKISNGQFGRINGSTFVGIGLIDLAQCCSTTSSDSLAMRDSKDRSPSTGRGAHHIWTDFGRRSLCSKGDVLREILAADLRIQSR